MAKNLTKSNPQPMAMQKDAKNMEPMAKSPNMKGSAYDMPLANNAQRMAMQHMGNVPNADKNGLR